MGVNREVEGEGVVVEGMVVEGGEGVVVVDG